MFTSGLDIAVRIARKKYIFIVDRRKFAPGYTISLINYPFANIYNNDIHVLNAKMFIKQAIKFLQNVLRKLR